MTNVKTTFTQAIFPIALFFLLLLFGLLVYPQLFGGSRLPLEVMVLIAITISCLQLFYLGYSWDEIQKHIVKKVGESIPVVLILFAIGVLIGSWIVSGTIPMLIYYGISIVSADWIYVFAFLICIVFSLLTGTSWGSAGTIGIVMISIAEIYGASLPITAAAVVGGSFFGDKMSPLSDTTNIASLATNVHVFDHIRSMMYTTGPSAILAALLYFFLSPGFSSAELNLAGQADAIESTLSELDMLFNFNLLLLLPLILVIWGSVRKKPIFLTLLGSAWLAMLLALFFQNVSFGDVFNSFNKGFNVSMVPGGADLKSNVIGILNRGGLYNLIEGIVISILIFAFIGVLDVIDAIPTALRSIMNKIKSNRQAVATALTATWITNLMASNQYATSFIIGAAFNKKFDQMKIKRKVLSRSLEDAGTMMENLAPWTPSGIFMATTLGVSVWEYAPFQFLSIINIIVAYIFALTGIACFYGKK